MPPKATFFIPLTSFFKSLSALLRSPRICPRLVPDFAFFYFQIVQFLGILPER